MRVLRSPRDSAFLHWSAGSSCRDQSISAQRCKSPRCPPLGFGHVQYRRRGALPRRFASSAAPVRPGGLNLVYFGGKPEECRCPLVSHRHRIHTCEGPRADRSLSFPPGDGTRLRSFGPISEGRDELSTLTRATSLACPAGNKAKVAVAAQNLCLTHIRKWQLPQTVRPRRAVRLRPVLRILGTIISASGMAGVGFGPAIPGAPRERRFCPNVGRQLRATA